MALPSPARRTRRRAAAVAVTLLATLTAAAATFLVLRHQALAELPLDRVEEARRALRRAEAAVGPTPATREATASLEIARRRAADLERHLAEARHAPWPPRHHPTLEALADEIGRATGAAVAAEEAHRRAVARDAARTLQRADDLLAEPTEGLARYPADRGLRTAVGRARLEIRRGRTALESGDAATADRAAPLALQAALEAVDHLERHTGRLLRPDLRRQWDRWVEGAVAQSRREPTILVDKDGGRTYLLRDGRVAMSFRSEIGRGGLAPKRHAGDAATPEGRYRVAEKRDRGQTRYHRALLLDYPNREDRERYAENRRNGSIPPGRGIGSLIEIHGDGGRGVNWTDGCVALANPDMDRLFAAVRVGTPVTIVGSATLPASAGAPEARP